MSEVGLVMWRVACLLQQAKAGSAMSVWASAFYARREGAVVGFVVAQEVRSTSFCIMRQYEVAVGEFALTATIKFAISRRLPALRDLA